MVGHILQHSFATLDLKGPRQRRALLLEVPALIKSFAPKALAAWRYSPQSAAPRKGVMEFAAM
jgi:hypothetical protein